MRIPSWLVGFFNPAHAYMERSSRAHGRDRVGRRRHQGGQRSFREAVVFGPGVSGGSREATADELRLLRAQSEEYERRWEARLSEIEERYSTVLGTKAAELVGTGSTTLRTNTGEVQARILRFRWGANVLEITRPGGESRSQLSRPAAREPAVLVHYLAHALAEVRSEGEPLVEGW